MTSTIKVDTISENTSANGVAVDGVTLKDGQVELADSKKILLGAGNDLQIYHDGTNSYIVDDGAGQLRIDTQGTDVRITKTNSEYMATFGIDGAVELYYDNVKKFETTSSGVTVTGATYSSGGVFNTVNNSLLTFGGGNAGNVGSNLALYGGASGSAGAFRFRNGTTVSANITASGQIEAISGGVSTPTYSFTNDTNTGMTRPTTDTLTLVTAGAERMRITSSGNVGIGTSSPTNMLDISGTNPVISLIETDQSNKNYLIGSFGGAFAVYDSTAGAYRMIVENGGNVVFNEGGSDCNFRIESDGNANMFKLDAGNNAIGIGSDPVSNSMLHIKQASSGQSSVSANAEEFVIEDDDNCGMTILSGTGNTGTISFGDSGDDNIGQVQYHHAENSLKFVVNANERARINSNGHFKAITTGSYVSATQFHEMTNDDGSQQVLYLRHTDSSNPYGLQVQFNNAAPDNNNHWFYIASDSGAVRFKVFSDGDVVNHDNAYGGISDVRIKQDIRDSNSQWDDIKAVKVRNFKKKDDVRQYGDNAWEQIGVVAQELETVSPKLIRHNDPDANDIISDSSFGTLWTADDVETQDAVLYTSDDQEVIDGNKNVGDIKTPSTKQIGDVKEIKEQVKSVNYSILYMKAIKALQEAMDRIETLEAKVTTLENN